MVRRGPGSDPVRVASVFSRVYRRKYVGEELQQPQLFLILKTTLAVFSLRQYASFAGMSDKSLFLLFNLARIGKIIFCIIYFSLPVGINLGSPLRLAAVLITSNFCRARFSPLSRVCLRNAFDAFFVLLLASRILHVLMLTFHDVKTFRFCRWTL